MQRKTRLSRRKLKQPSINRVIEQNPIPSINRATKKVNPGNLSELPYDIFAYCSKNYKDAYDFVIDSWIQNGANNITLYTDFALESPHKKVTIVPFFKQQSTDWITGTGRRLDVIQHYTNERGTNEDRVFFMDIDCLILHNVGHVFHYDFDIALTRLTSTELHANKTATAGLWFAKLTDGFFHFRNDWMNLARKYRAKNYGTTQHRISYVQYSFTDIARAGIKSDSYKILSLNENIYNSEHTLLNKWIEKIQKNPTAILHFKGRRFRNPKLVKAVLEAAK